jgi:hypothetical protein
MPPRIRTLLALVAAALLAAPASAWADRVYSATVIAPATTDQAHRLVLPLLLSKHGQKRAGRPVIVPVVPSGARPIRWGGDHLALAQLRPGDHLRLKVHGHRARWISLQRSGTADDFDRVARQLADLRAAVDKTAQLATPVAAAAGGSYPRDQLATLREQVSDLQGQLDAVDADVQTSLDRLAAVRPKDPQRRAAVVFVQNAYAQQLTAIRDAARAARQQSDLAAEGLDAVVIPSGSTDGTKTPVDPAAPIELPFGTISTVSDLTRTLVVLSDQLGLAAPPLVG